MSISNSTKKSSTAVNSLAVAAVIVPNSIYGTTASETIYGTINGDTIYGGDGGNDTIIGRDGDDTIYGNIDGSDKLYGGIGNDVIFGGLDNFSNGNEENNGSGIDIIHGNEGNDVLYAGAEVNVTIHGDAGDDVIWGSLLGSLFGGIGNDTIYAHESESSLSVYGGAGDDKFDLNGNDMVAYGGWGNDQISVLSESISPNALVYGGHGEDAFTIETAAVAYGEQGNDVFSITWFDENYSGSKVYGGSGNDSVAYDNDESNGANHIFGGAGDDYLHGSTVENADKVHGDGGNDNITYGGEIYGGWGNDSIVSGYGDDLVYGGGGADLITVNRKLEDRDFEYGTESTDKVYGGAGNDVIIFGETDSYDEYRDTSVTNTLSSIYGENGSDNISVKGIFNVEVFGGNGNDVISAGGTVYDAIAYGESPVDVAIDYLLSGGRGADSFMLTANTGLGEEGRQNDHTTTTFDLNDFKNDVDTVSMEGFGVFAFSDFREFSHEIDGNVVFTRTDAENQTNTVIFHNITFAQLQDDLFFGLVPA